LAQLLPLPNRSVTKDLSHSSYWAGRDIWRRQAQLTSDQRADTDAVFEQLFRDYRQPVLTYIYRLLGERARAEELTQQAFVKAYLALPRLPAEANRRSWLYRIATNTCYDYLRRRRLVRWLPLLERDGSGSTESGPELLASERDAVQRTLAQLAPRDRAVLILYCVQGYSTVEIGEMLGISQGAVKTRLCRARERFRQAYGEEN
jgi:RNA polymerase sigma-70 factor (ECF subfamily)